MEHWSGSAHQTSPIMKHDTRSHIAPDTLLVPPNRTPKIPVTTTMKVTTCSDVRVAVTRQNFLMIQGKFAELVMNASCRLQSIVDIDDFRVFVVTLFAPGHCIPDSASVQEIFLAITKNGLWDCVNHFPLKLIIKEFASGDTQLSEWVRQYEEARSGYILCTKVSDYIDVVGVSDSSDMDSDEKLEEMPAKYDRQYFRKLSVKLNANVTEKSIQYIIELWKSLASYYRLPSPMAILERIARGCILVTWLVPTKLTLELVKKARANPDFFQEHNVLWAAVDDDHDYLYHSKEERVKMLAQSKVSVICCSTKKT